MGGAVGSHPHQLDDWPIVFREDSANRSCGALACFGAGRLPNRKIGKRKTASVPLRESLGGEAKGTDERTWTSARPGRPRFGVKSMGMDYREYPIGHRGAAGV